MNASPTRKPVRRPIRKTYRHGDLRRALVEAGVALAREGGPEAVVLREATRRAGVVPNAAYRHFADRAELFEAVRAAALRAAAVTMEACIAELGAPRADTAYARASLRAVGRGYLRFARTETGLFRTAFGVRFDRAPVPDPRAAGASNLNPFQLLGAALDRMVAARAMSAAARPDAEFLAWSAVHGLALLGVDGPLRHLPASGFELLGERVVNMVERGLEPSV